MTGTDLTDLNADPTTAPEQVIAIDFDGVITRPHEKKAATFSAAGYNIAPEDTTRKKCLADTEMSESVYERIVRLVNVPELETVPLRSGVKDGLERLSAAGFSPVIVTSRYDTEVGAMRQYLADNDLPVFGYINTGRQSKHRPVTELGAHAFVDDSASKFEPFFRAYATQTDLFYFQHEANCSTTVSHDEITIVETWNSFVDSIIDT